MKRTATLLSIFLSISTFFHAQEPCATGRYSTDVFTNVTVTSNIVYGQNYKFNNALMVLKLDFYEPTGDTETARPLIIWAHGGSFLGGTKTDVDVAALSQAFAKKGYACASIEYRTGFFPIDSANSVKAVVRAVQDMRASVRYFYKDAADGINQYKIDTNNIARSTDMFLSRD
jgi:carboxylesterase type B